MANHTEQLRMLLSNNQGLAIGEEHWTTAVPSFLTDSMDVFKASGVSTIYTELVSSQDDRYLQNYSHNPTPESLEKIRPVLGDKTNTDQVLKMIEKAQCLGIRIVGIDQQPRPKQWDENTRKMVDHPYGHIITNKFWADRVEEDRASHPDGKFIVHGGNLHMTGMIFSHTPADYKPLDTVPSLLGIPHIHVRTESVLGNLGLSGNEVNSEIPTDERLGSLDITISREYEVQPALRGGGMACQFDMK